VLLAFSLLRESDLPATSSIATLTLAELAAGPLATTDPMKSAERLERLAWAQARFDAIPFDLAAAHAYARIYAAMKHDQKPRGTRAVDYLIAATALSRNLPLYTRNAVDFKSIGHLIEIVAV